MHIYIHIHIHVYICIYIYAYVYTHKQTQTHTQNDEGCNVADVLHHELQHTSTDECLNYCAQEYKWDLRGLARELNLDIYSSIRFVNFLRKHVVCVCVILCVQERERKRKIYSNIGLVQNLREQAVGRSERK